MLSVRRVTFETDVVASLRVVQTRSITQSWVQTGIGFLDHVLRLFAACSGMTLNICCVGDSWVDWHHTCEDVGIALGLALSAAIRRHNPLRYGFIIIPMDEALVRCSFDLHGGGGFHSSDESHVFKASALADLSFTVLDALAKRAGICLHVDVLKASNTHHAAEAMFKAFGLCCRNAFNASRPLTTKGDPLILWR